MILYHILVFPISNGIRFGEGNNYEGRITEGHSMKTEVPEESAIQFSSYSITLYANLNLIGIGLE